GTVSTDITAPDGRTERTELQKNDSAWGSFSGRFKVTLPGEWKLRATAGGAEDKRVETVILAQGTEIEKSAQPARPEVLEEMARIARGRVIQPDQLPDLIKEITALPEPRPLEKRMPLLSHWATLVAIVVLL